jgi:hypothetical protein
MFNSDPTTRKEPLVSKTMPDATIQPWLVANRNPVLKPVVWGKNKNLWEQLLYRMAVRID